MNNRYYKTTRCISVLFLLMSIILGVIFIWSMADEAILKNDLMLRILGAISITDIPTPLFVFCSAVMYIFMALVGLNIKKGTGAAGCCVIFGFIMTFVKACDIFSVITSGSLLSARAALTVIFTAVFFIFAYCAVKQWDTD